MRDTIRAIMFDWGGTIVRTDRQSSTYTRCAAAVVGYLRRSGVAVSAAAADKLTASFAETIETGDGPDNLREVDSAALIGQWAEDAGVVLDGVAPAHLVAALWQPWIGCLDVMGTGRRSIAQLHAAGLTLGLVSNCAVFPPVCHVELEREGLEPYLAFTLFTSEIGVRKPHRRVYETAFDRAQAAVAAAGRAPLEAGEVLFVGDTPGADVDGPGAFGMRTVLVRSGRWRGDVADLDRTPDLILDSIDDLPRHLT